MDSINLGSSHISTRSADARRSPGEAGAQATGFRSTVILSAPEKLIAVQGATKLQRLVADRRYFGLGAQAFRAGAERALARLSAQPPEQARIDAHSLAEDFHLDGAASLALQSELLKGGLLQPDGSGRYLPTRRFRQYALACVVAPLSRARAKALIDRACGLAARLNTELVRNPFLIDMMAVSGGYMSCRDQLSELSLWLIPDRRREVQTRRGTSLPSKDDALREFLEPIDSLSSFVVARMVADRQAVPRPFSVVFQASEEATESSSPRWGRFRDWGASLARRSVSR
jgi:hypothetical protein